MPGTGQTTISARYIAALNNLAQSKGGLVTASRAEVWSGETNLTPLGLQIEASSTVTVDRNNLSRATCSLVLTDPFAGTPEALVPQDAGDLLYPVGNELVVYNGITYPDGTQELIQLGVFGLIDADFDDQANDLVITLVGSDRSVACQHAGFTSAYTIAPGTNVGAAIQTLLASLQTGLSISYAFTPTASVTPTTPIVYLPGDDPFAKANDLATSIGNELFFAPTGVCTMIPVPDPMVAGISWDYVE